MHVTVQKNYIILNLVWFFLLPNHVLALADIGIKGIGPRGSFGIIGNINSRIAYGLQVDMGEISPRYRLFLSYERIPGLNITNSNFKNADVFNIDVLNWGRNSWVGLNSFIGLGLSVQFVRERGYFSIFQKIAIENTEHNFVPNFILGWQLPFQNQFSFNLEFRINLLGYFESDIIYFLRLHIGFMFYFN